MESPFGRQTPGQCYPLKFTLDGPKIEQKDFELSEDISYIVMK